MSTRIARTLLRLMWCWVLVGVSGCATHLSSTRTLDRSEGAVVFKLVSDTAERFSMFSLVSQIHLQRVSPADDDVKGLVLSNTRLVTRGTMVFSGVLKPGRYKFLHATGANGSVTVHVPLESFLDTFEVREGEITFLGTFVFRPVDEVVPKRAFWFTSRFEFGYVPTSAELIASFERHFPALAAQVKGKPVRVLDLTPELNAAVQRALQYRGGNTRTLNGLWQDDKGNFFAGGRMGKVILKKAGQAEWREVNVGSWDEVSTVRPYQRGLLAGGEDGLLRFSADEGTTWRSLAAPTWGHVQHLEVLPNGRVLAFVRHGALWTVFASDDVLGGNWQKFSDLIPADQLSNIRGLSSGVLYLSFPPSVALHRDALILTEEGNRFLLSMNTQTGKVEQIVPPLGSISQATSHPGGALVLTGTLFKSVIFVSNDDGKTWREVRPRGLLVFRDSLVGYAIYGKELGHTRDGGKTWTYPKTNATWGLDDAREFVIDRSDGALVVALFDGSVYRSVDEGRQWKKEL